jgi:hypothetical protein
MVIIKLQVKLAELAKLATPIFFIAKAISSLPLEADEFSLAMRKISLKSF